MEPERSSTRRSSAGFRSRLKDCCPQASLSPASCPPVMRPPPVPKPPPTPTLPPLAPMPEGLLPPVPSADPGGLLIAASDEQAAAARHRTNAKMKDDALT